MSSVADNALDALAGARHADPFSILGPHRLDRGGVVVRALRPAAESIVVIGQGPDVQMMRAHAGGIFEAAFPQDSQIFDYRLRIITLHRWALASTQTPRLGLSKTGTLRAMPTPGLITSPTFPCRSPSLFNDCFSG